MTENENKYSIGLPFSVILCIICATGGSGIFASLFSGIALLLAEGNDYSVLFVKDYIFVFVFCTIYSATFVAQMKRLNGGKWWKVAHQSFLLFYLTAYIFRFWPQTPQLIPDFTIRAFLWYGGSLALSLVASRYASDYFEFLSLHGAIRSIYLVRNLSLTLGVLIVVIPIALAMFYNIAINLPVVFSMAPSLLLFFSSALYVFREKTQLNFEQLCARLLILWHPLGWCFLTMPVILLAEKFLSRYYLEIFIVEPVHFYSAILSFVVLILIALLGGLVGGIAKRGFAS